MNNIPYNPSVEYLPQRTQIVLPAFSYTGTWLGVSKLLARYPITNTVAFSLRRPIYHPTGDFVLAVSWAEAPYVYRYKLSDLGDTLAFPVYNGEKVGVAAYIEVWSTADEVATMTTDFMMETSQLIEPTCTSVQCTNSTTSITLVESPFVSVPPNQECNPFCSPLCT